MMALGGIILVVLFLLSATPIVGLAAGAGLMVGAGVAAVFCREDE